MRTLVSVLAAVRQTLRTSGAVLLRFFFTAFLLPLLRLPSTLASSFTT